MADVDAKADLRTAAEQRYLSYAISVITSRALPDARDGLKPVQRRILFAMFQNLRLTADAKARKSAQIVGEVIGKYHPHGDTAAYDAMVRMAQDFSLRYPLVHGEGNFGSLDGDSAAAYRYTEARLTKIAEEMLRELGSDTVDWRPNYDSTQEEPVVLPSRLPQLLMNGSTGIAVGMATNIPPHNLTETVDALVALIDRPDLDVAGLMEHLQGPDFPTGGEILSTRQELLKIYETGQGPVRLRGQYDVEDLPRGKRQVVLSSVPYTVNKANLVESIAGLVTDRKLPQVTDVRDESTADVRVVLELKGDADPDVVMAYVLRHTDLQINFNVNLTVLSYDEGEAAGQPGRVSLKDLCRQFLDFRMEVVERRLEFERRKLLERIHILEGFVAVYDDLDLAIKLIRESESKADAASKLMKAFSLDDVQAEAILQLRLYHLARLEIEKIREELAEKRARLAEVEALLADEAARWAVIRGELMEIREEYGDERRSTLLGEEAPVLNYDPEAYVVHEEATVLLTRDGWIKRVKELKDPASARIREGDALAEVMPGSTRDRLALFSNRGVVYVTAVADLPATTGYGDPVQSMFRFKDGERILRAFLLDGPAPTMAEPAEGEDVDPEDQQELFAGGDSSEVIELVDETLPLLIASSTGYGFRCTPDLSVTTRSGRKIARLPKNDELVTISEIKGDQVVCLSRNGRGVRFPLDEVAELSGVGRGVILLRLDEGDRLAGAVVTPARRQLRALMDAGNERKLGLDAFPAGRRGNKGNRVVKRGVVQELGPSPLA